VSLVIVVARSGLADASRRIALDDVDTEVGQCEEQFVELLDGEIQVV